MEDFYQSIARILFILIKCNEISIQVMYIKSFEIIKHPLIAHPCTNFISFFPQWMLLTFAQCRLVSLISTHSFRVRCATRKGFPGGTSGKGRARQSRKLEI